MSLRLLRVLTSLIVIAHFASVTGSAALVSNVSSWAGADYVSETGIDATRFLRVSGVGGDGGEERAGPTAPIVEKVQTLVTASNAAPEKLQKLLNAENSADDAFTLLNLDKVGDALFSIGNYKKLTQWLSSGDDLSAKSPAVGTSAISTLLTHYDDATLYTLITKAKRISRTKDVATKLQTE
ncbi:hypothetical protein PHYSODRAFT_286671 [Phytophthora sojae]|uniref:RxLR effector protein n=2 Tax=Phytophthora sojae TaxID=67593 RepID=G4ZV74_PHYSP|nr:hypothetical protein PHYSODRAFT_286671 [Phytophthora sojae]AEK81186.1 Avh333 [Phytophthora sojae]AEK81187.1 Avh333 [Phytophthora sojae]AEK81188.1 Avh333 [Phytophthora sojae]EGZ13698.1 hypothetical protein PHYSODRAFT_286671 [Phytophthora sojae]|eukprot:XP_009531127.1 hypothetical protein PHYSODRAFT_286671 [Phytophthora sojae]